MNQIVSITAKQLWDPFPDNSQLKGDRRVPVAADSIMLSGRTEWWKSNRSGRPEILRRKRSLGRLESFAASKRHVALTTIPPLQLQSASAPG